MMCDVYLNGTAMGEANSWASAIRLIKPLCALPASYVDHYMVRNQQPADTRTLEGKYWRAEHIPKQKRYVFTTADRPFQE